MDFNSADSNAAMMYIRLLSIEFITVDEVVYSSDRLIDIANFISSVGGNLGLFLGFSFLSLLFQFYDKAERYINIHYMTFVENTADCIAGIKHKIFNSMKYI